MTPQEMRELADEHWMPIPHEQTVAAALRAAADQLDAVRPDRDLLAGMIGGHEGHDYPLKVDYILADAVLALFTADTAPQEDRDD